MNDLEVAVDFISNLIILCEVPQKDRDKVFKKISIRVGDYMGTGYIFLDKYNKIYEEFLYNAVV